MSMKTQWLRKGFSLTAAMVCALSIPIGSSQAALVTYSFTGMTDAPTALTVFGSFQFDNATGGTGGVYNGAVRGFSLTIGDYTSTFAPGINGVQISRNSDLGGGLSGDRWKLVSAATGPELGGTVPFSFDLHLDREGGGLFVNTALQDPPSFGSLSEARWRLFFEGPRGIPFAFVGSIASLTAVPLPPAVLLFGMGLIALVGLGVGGLRNLRAGQG
ncbi:MAG: hypothetical protein A4E19_01270 [Nitrospira sp. SG-bin1]|nr:MAG: hypothetical protein A4E19_01270 [Nitrospira sp. SG-bin1]